MPRQRTGAIAFVHWTALLKRNLLACTLAMPIWVQFSGKLPILAFILCSLIPFSAHAAPSCGLEKWLTNLNTAANAYVNALGTPDQLSAERAFRAQMERYSRAQLVDQINEADLGANKEALESFIVARRHLYDLSRDDWGQMAERFGRDERFASQSQSMSAFLQGTECDPFAEDFLNKDDTKPSVLKRIEKAISNLTEEPEDTPEEDAEPSPLLFDPDDFEDYRAPRYMPQENTIEIPVSPSQNAPVFLGLFTFVISISIWVWMRIGLAQRRAIRYPCNLPIVVFDGSAPILSELRDLSQLGAKLETGLKLRPRSKLLITMNDTKRRARVAWTNQHFVGITFEQTLSEIEMTDILEVFAARVNASYEVSDGFANLLDEVYGTAATKLSNYLPRSNPEDAADGSLAQDSEVDGIAIKNVYAPEAPVQDPSEPTDETLSDTEADASIDITEAEPHLDADSDNELSESDVTPDTIAPMDTNGDEDAEQILTKDPDIAA